jgi:hypothetical protein
LLKQIHRAEIKLKGTSTMIANLHTRKEEVQEQIDLIARQFGQDGVDNADLAMQEVLGEDWDLHSIQLQRNMLATFNSMLVSSLEPLASTLTDR